MYELTNLQPRAKKIKTNCQECTKSKACLIACLEIVNLVLFETKLIYLFFFSFFFHSFKSIIREIFLEMYQRATEF